VSATPPSAEAVIMIRDLRFRYPGTGEDVLRVPFLDVPPTGMTAVTGPSGAGKSTLIELLAGTLREPYEGSVSVLGAEWQSLTRDADRQRQLRRIGLIPQDFGLLTNRTPTELLGQDLADSGVPKDQRDARIAAALAAVGLAPFAGREIAGLSGGQRQRVAIARMLARQVECVIADEPTANLDPALTAETMAVFRQLAGYVPVVIITHDPAVAAACDRTIVLQSAVTTPASTIDPGQARRPRRVSRPLAAIIAVGVLAIAGTIAAIVIPAPGGNPGAGPATHASTGRAVPQVHTAPAPHLGQFVPASQRVVRVYRFNLTGAGVPVVAVTTTSQPTANTPIPAQDLLLLAWDNYARRWSGVYDAAKTPVNVTYEPDAYTNSYQASAAFTPQPLFQRGLGVTGIRLTEIHDQHRGGADLMVSAGVAYADGIGQATGIIHYNGLTAQVAWAFIGDGGAATVIGKAPGQKVAVTSAWLTPADPHCCPARNYRFVVAPAISQLGESYRVISDNRPWLGVFIAVKSPLSRNPQAIVTAVVPGSPAAGVLQPGDILQTVAGPPIASHGLGPAVIDELGVRHAGNVIGLQIQRGGAFMSVTVKLGSLADPKAINAGFNIPSSEDML
jgi:ABC-type lipoprotein export system ATPase subunit